MITSPMKKTTLSPTFQFVSCLFPLLVPPSQHQKEVMKVTSLPIPSLRVNALSLSQSNVMSNVRFSQMSFMRWRIFSFVTGLLRIFFVMCGCGIFDTCFLFCLY